MKNWLFPLGLLILLAAVSSWVLFAWQADSPGSDGRGASSGTDFVMHSQHGPVMSADLKGKVVLLYFGYTWCPDICPSALTLMSMALRQLGAEELAQVQGIFVSVDPGRDTLERLSEYAKYFHPSLIGVTDTPEGIADLARQFGAAYREVDAQSSTVYTVDHTSETYVIDRQGRLVETLPHGARPEAIVASVRRLLGNVNSKDQ